MDKLARTVNLRQTHHLKRPIAFTSNIGTTYHKALGDTFYAPILGQFKAQSNVSSVNYVPNVVSPMATIEERGKALAQKLDAMAHKYNEKVHLVAYSFAGADARAAISMFGAHEFVSSLTTICTPH